MPAHSPRRRARRFYCYAAAIFSAFTQTSLFSAVTGNWIGGTGTWNVGTNWSSNPSFPNGVDDTANIIAGGINPVVMVGAPITVGTLNFNSLSAYTLNAAAGGSITLSSSSLPALFYALNTTVVTLPLHLQSNLHVSGPGPIGFTGPLSGTGDLFLTDRLNLTGNNINWNPTLITVDFGRLSSGGGITSFGNPNTGTIKVSAGASLNVAGIQSSSVSQFTKALQLSGTGSASFPGALAAGASSILCSDITLTGNATLFASAGATLTLGLDALPNLGSVSGPGALTVAGQGTVRIAVPAMHTGGTFVTDGILQIATPYSSPITTAGGQLQLLAPTSGNITANGGVVTLSAAGTSPIALSGGTLNLSAPTSQAIAQTGGLLNLNASASSTIQVSAGLLAMSAPNSAAIALSGGSLLLTSNGSGPIFQTGGTLVLQGASTGTISVTAGTVRYNSGTVAPQSITLSGGRFLINNDPSLNALFAPASTTGDLVYSAPSTLTFGGTFLADFSAFAPGNTFSLISSTSITLHNAVSLKPEPLTRTLRFGAAGYTGTITLQNPIADFNGNATHVAIVPGTTLYFGTASSYSGITTINGLVQVNHAAGLGTGTGSAADGTVLNSGRLITGPGVTLGNELITVNGGTLTVATTGPVLFNSPAQIGGSFAGALSGTGDITFNTGQLSTLSGDNPFTGKVFVPTGTLQVSSPNALGSTVQGTTINGGILLLSAASAEPLALSSGTLTATAPHSGTLLQSGGVSSFHQPGAGTLSLAAGTMTLSVPGSQTVLQSGGRLVVSGASTGQTFTDTFMLSGGTLIASNVPTFQQPLQINGPGTVTLGLGSPVTLAGGISGSGNLLIATAATISGPVSFVGNFTNQARTTISNSVTQGSFTNLPASSTLTLSGAFHHTGDMLLPSEGTTTLISGPSVVIDGRVALSGQTLRINGNATIGHLQHFSGLVTGTGTLTLGTPKLVIHGGNFSFSGNLQGVTEIAVQAGASEAAVRPPAAYPGVISVESGGLSMFTGSVTPVVINSPDGFASAFSINVTRIIDNPLFLNNSAGFIVRPKSDVVLNGAIDLGTQGSTFTADEDEEDGFLGLLRVTGPITGGTLKTRGPIELTIQSNSPVTGTVQINSAGIVTLQNNGAFPSAAGIVISNAALHLDNAFQLLPDRLADSTPITLAAGQLRFSGIFTPAAATETVGAVTLVAGHNTLIVNEPTGAGSAQLTLASLVRNGTATVSMNRGFGGTLGGSLASDPRLLITAQPLTDYMGPAFVVDNIDFAKYTARGVSAFAPGDYFAADQSLWSASAHVTTAGTALTASRTVNTLRVVNGGIPLVLDLGSHTLNIAGNGMIFGGGSITGNGRLTAGGTAPSQLFFHNAGNTTLQASISNNPGPDGLYAATPGGLEDADNAPISVIFSNGTSTFHLTTANTFTGTTFINGASVYIDHPEALSTTQNIVIDGGGLRISGTGTLTLPPVTIRHGGILTSPLTFQGPRFGFATLNNPNVTIESGILGIPVIGTGTVTKITDAPATMWSSANFQGTVSVQGGVLSTGSVPALSLQNGTLRLVPFLGGPIPVTKPITFGPGGMLDLQSPVTFTPSSISVTGDATLFIRATAYVDGPTDRFTDAADPSHHLNISVASSTQIQQTPAALFINSGLHNAGRITGTGTVTTHLDSTLTLASAYFPFSGGLAGYGRIILRPDMDPSTAVSVGSLSLSNDGPGTQDGQLDLTNHAFVVPLTTTAKPTVVASLKQYLLNGAINAAGGPWAGPGITSSTSIGIPYTKIALADNRDLHLTSFRGVPIDEESLILVAARFGDATLDNKVDAFDLNLLAARWQQSSGALWSAGDFTGDGIVNAFDLNLLASNWQFGASGSLQQTFESALASTSLGDVSVPEPASFLLLAGVVPLAFRRRRSGQFGTTAAAE